MRRVVVVQRVVPHYRVPFFEGLRTALADRGVDLVVVRGQPSTEETARGFSGPLPWATEVQNRYWQFGRRSIVWQPCLKHLRSADLVIVEHASRLLVNYPLLAWRRVGGPRVAWWGHGRNFDSDSAHPFSERLKGRLAREADWWFCYTEGSARIVEQSGVPREQLTVVQNAVDTAGVRRARSALSDAQVAATRAELGIGDGPVGVYVGSLYGSKRIPYLIEACDRIRSLLPCFHLVVIGDGPDRSFADAASSSRPWVHVIGARTGEEMVKYGALGSVVLNPGLVGLSVLDAFALGLPMVTCDQPYHSPEIEYLVDGENGLVLPATASEAEYGDSVVALVNDIERLQRLSAGALTSAAQYTVEEMVHRFATGILMSLARAK